MTTPAQINKRIILTHHRLVEESRPHDMQANVTDMFRGLTKAEIRDWMRAEQIGGHLNPGASKEAYVLVGLEHVLRSFDLWEV